ncbi:MAG: ABC transporter substrate-binding protein [Bacteroidales bacterium]|nr:ABC transporter substrate-binding protein [Bacteroidales bacterium]
MKRIKIIAIVFFVLCTLGSCKTNNQNETIKIGALLSLTGDNAQQGNLAQNGILVAVDKINEEGGINGKKIKLVIEDTRTDANGTITAMNKIAKLDKVSGIIVTGDTELPIVNQLADNYGIPIIATICTGMIDKNRSDLVFRYCYNEEQEDRYMMRFIKQDLNISKMALIYPNSTAGQAFYSYSKKYIDANEIKIVADIPYDIQTSNIQRENAIKIITAKPEIICARGFGSSLDALLKHISELGYRGRIIGDLSLSVPSAVKNTNGILNGAYIVASDLDLKSENKEIATYASLYKTKYGIDPCFWDAIAYDSFIYLCYALNRSEKESIPFKDAIFSTKPNNLLLGNNWFDSGNDVNFQMHMFEMTNGELTRIK